MSEHAIQVTFDEGGVSYDFICHAPPDAICRTRCAHRDCIEGCADKERHQRQPIDYCNVVEWMDCIDQPATEGATIAMPIDIRWNKGHPNWVLSGPQQPFRAVGFADPEPPVGSVVLSITGKVWQRKATSRWGWVSADWPSPFMWEELRQLRFGGPLTLIYEGSGK